MKLTSKRKARRVDVCMYEFTVISKAVRDLSKLSFAMYIYECRMHANRNKAGSHCEI